MIRDIPSSLQKRIKRRVTARVHQFFVATSPHLETLCLTELERLPLSVKEMETVAGGVAFAGIAATNKLGSPWMGVLIAILAGMLLGLVHAVVLRGNRTDQVLRGKLISIR